MNMGKYLNKYNVSFALMCFFFCITLCLVSATLPGLLILIGADLVSYFIWRKLTKGMSDEELCNKMGLIDTIFDFTKE